jgi:hypothetical protein
MKQAGVDIGDEDQPTNQLKWKIHDFCNTAAPNLYDLLASFLAWLKSTHEPVDDATQLGGIPAVTILASRFTSTSGMNQRTVLISMPKSMQGPWPFPWETPTSGDASPTQYLQQQQLLENWPYTTYGVARKAEETTSFPLTDPKLTNVTVAWLYHRLVWNPRPLFTPQSARKETYQPALQDWTAAFSDANALNVTIDASTTTTTSSSTKTSDPIATPAMASQVSFTFPTLKTTSSTFTYTSISAPTTLSPPSPSPTPLLPSPRPTPIRPPYRQESVYTKVPDPLGFVPGGRGKRRATAIDDLWGEIESVQEQLSGER